jgi:pimeloyl-ACP methyl ester carboxylesterase
MKSAILLLLFSCFIGACNVLKIVDRKQEKRYDKRGIQLYRFKDDKAQHAVHYSNNGKKKLMMIHGYGASGIGQYFRSGLDLSKEYDVILPDLLYCGKSTGDGVDFSIDSQVEHLHLILDSLHIHEPIVVIGNSYGGIVAAYFAEKYPELVRKLVIYDAPINDYTSAYADSLALSLGVPSLKELLAPTCISENKISLDMVFYKQPYVPRFVRRQMVKYGSVPARPTQLKLLDHLIANEANMNAHFYDWKMPVYLFWGDHDMLIPMTTYSGIKNRYKIPDENCVVFEKAAHAINVENPEKFVQQVRAIMAD